MHQKFHHRGWLKISDFFWLSWAISRALTRLWRFRGPAALPGAWGTWGLADLVTLVTFQPCFGVVFRYPQTTISKNTTYVLKTQIQKFVIMRMSPKNALKVRVQMVWKLCATNDQIRSFLELPRQPIYYSWLELRTKTVASFVCTTCLARINSTSILRRKDVREWNKITSCNTR